MQRGCTNAGRKLIWPHPLTPGQYDIIIDVDRDGLYDEGSDILDGYLGTNSRMGFTVAQANTRRSWTVLIYADGEGGLHDTRFQYKDDIAAALDVNSQVNVVILFDGDDAASDVDQRSTSRYIVTHGSATLDAGMGELNMGDPLVLEEFLTWGITNYPADHYIVALSNHGGSWFKENHPVPNELDYTTTAAASGTSVDPRKAICYDHGDGLNMYELDRVFRNARAMVGSNLDIVLVPGMPDGRN